MIIFKDTEQKLTNQEISEFETQFNIKLPELYKTHILNYNGGYPEINLFFDESYPIDNFKPIKYGNYTIEKSINNLSEHLPQKSLPFADSTSGVIYMILNDSDYEKIYVMYSDGQTDFLANSFKDFIDGLSENQE